MSVERATATALHAGKNSATAAARRRNGQASEEIDPARALAILER